MQIWKTARTHGSELQTVHEPTAWRLFEGMINDVMWTGHDTFVVGGDAGSSILYQIDGSQEQGNESQSAGSIAMRGLTTLNSNILSADHAWDFLRTDQKHKLAAFASDNARKLVLTPRVHSPDLSSEMDFNIDLAGNLAALEFQPAHITIDDGSIETETRSSNLLAVAFDEGPCRIYTATRKADGTIHCMEGPVLSLAEGQSSTTALAWSSRGDYLAVGNEDLVQIWHKSSLMRDEGAALSSPDAYVTWRPAQEPNGLDNEQLEDEIEQNQPSLSWSSDDRLAHAAGKQVRAIRRPYHVLLC